MTRRALKASALVLVSVFVVFGIGCSDDRGRSRVGFDSGVTPPVDGGTRGDAALDSATPPPLTCDDGLRNGDETHLDCGGSCPPCADGQGCVDLSDCTSMVCRSGFCLMPSCADAMLNGDEIAVDCGAGGTCPGCPGGIPCTTTADQCLSGLCDGGTRSDTSCSGGMMNADESDLDCGGSICTGCPGTATAPWTRTAAASSAMPGPAPPRAVVMASSIRVSRTSTAAAPTALPAVPGPCARRGPTAPHSSAIAPAHARHRIAVTE